MPRTSRYPLRQWIWRAFVQSALIPLILVETVFTWPGSGFLLLVGKVPGDTAGCPQ